MLCAAHTAFIGLPASASGDGLKAAKMCGWNEPERVNVQSVEVKVDAALIEQLRAGYAQMSERRMGPPIAIEVGQGGLPLQNDQEETQSGFFEGSPALNRHEQ
jgi:hypothetical protein